MESVTGNGRKERKNLDNRVGSETAGSQHQRPRKRGNKERHWRGGRRNLRQGTEPDTEREVMRPESLRNTILGSRTSGLA